MRKKLLYLFQNILILLITIFILSAVSEIVLRVYWHKKWVNPTYIYRYSFYREIFYELNPGWSGDFGGKKVKINSHGLRDDEFPLKKPADEFRILVLGDSMAFGWKVDRQENFAETLERRLNSQFKDCHYQVINASVPGYNAYQEVYYLKRMGLKFDPDLVILNIFINDIVDYSGRPVRVIPQLLLIDYPRDTKDLVRKSYFMQFLLLKWDILKETYAQNQQLKGFNNCDDFLKGNINEENQNYWQAFMHQLGEFDKVLDDNNLKGILVYAPDIKEYNTEDEWRGLKEKISDFAQGNNICFIDLLPDYEASSDWPFLSKEYPGDYHLNDVGHKIEAEAIYDLLVKEKLIPSVKNKNRGMIK